MATTQAEQQFFWQLRWSLRDVVALVVVSIVLGLVFYFWDWVYQFLNRLLGGIASGLFYGVWYWAGLLLAYAIRKPGAALLGEFGAALVEFALGAPLGILVLVLGFVQGLALEVVFAWARYNHWGPITMVVAGVMAGLADFAVSLVAPPLLFEQLSRLGEVEGSFAINFVAPPFLLGQRSGGVIIATLCTVVISGAVLGGVVSKILGDRLLAIPAARNFLGTPVSQGG
jgi:energy-coupling factor transport system substrate-specific component